MLAVLIGIAAGAASTAQASVNGRIREDYRSTYLTAVLSFIVAIIILVLIVMSTEHNMHIPFGRIAEYPFWIWLGGSCGTAIITLNVVCLPYLGSARNVMIICFGQTMAGLLIDHAGLLGSPVVKMTLMRAAGATIVIIGAALVNGIRHPGASGAEADPGKVPEKGVILFMILAMLNGFACAAQVAINGSLNMIVESASKATLISMSVGLITTLLLILILTVTRGRMSIYDDGIRGTGLVRGFRPWMAIGGALSIVVVCGNAVTAPLLGTGIVTILNLIGMMGAGLIIDAAGFLGIEKKPITAAKLIGMILMIAGTAIISLL